MYICMYVCMYVRMHASMHACMHVCTYRQIDIQVPIYSTDSTATETITPPVRLCEVGAWGAGPSEKSWQALSSKLIQTQCY